MKLSNALALATKYGTVRPFSPDQFIVAVGDDQAIVFRVRGDRVTDVVYFHDVNGKVQGVRCRTLTAATRRLTRREASF